jgi:hypothetical protein
MHQNEPDLPLEGAYMEIPGEIAGHKQPATHFPKGDEPHRDSTLSYMSVSAAHHPISPTPGSW